MDVDRFSASPVGRLIPISGFDARHNEHYEHFAFVPTGLAETVIRIDSATAEQIERSVFALGRLDTSMQFLPRPEFFVRNQVFKEARDSAAIEGTFTVFTDVLTARADASVERTRDLKEVLNYAQMAFSAFAEIERRPLSLQFIRSLHGMLFEGFDMESGDFRDTQVVIGPEDVRVVDSRFVPPPPGATLHRLLDDWIAWRGPTDGHLSLVARMAVSHYQFEVLHPFEDGNGRIGRLLFLLTLLSEGRLQQPILAISSWLVHRRREYQDHLAQVSETGDFNPLVRFMSAGLAAAADSAVKKAQDLVAFQDGVREVIRSTPLRGAARTLAEELYAEPVFTVRQAADRAGVTPQAANSAVRKLAELGLVQQAGPRRYNRVFICGDVIRIIDR